MDSSQTSSLPSSPGAPTVDTADATGGQAMVVTASAVRRILALQGSEGPDHFLRLAVQSGGCSGFQYLFSFDHEIRDEDHVWERDGARLVVDEISMDLLKGAVLDYTEDLMSAQFVLRNPQATSRCGCGNSFSVI